MNAIKIYENKDFGEIRTIEENGKVLFCGSDVAKALGYAIPTKAVNTHCKGVSKMEVPTNGGVQSLLFITEGDMYRLIAHSKLESAERFESWVFDEVLPSIRKHGAYMTPETLRAALLNPDTVIQLCQALKAEQNKNRQLQAINSALTVDKAIMQPKADYFDELVDRNLLTNFRETAKQLGIKQRQFVDWLIEHKYVYRDKKGKLMPYAGKGDDLFEVKECFNEKTEWSGTQTLITPKGRETFRLLLEIKTA